MTDSHDPNPFAVLGLPVRFDLDQGSIERAYLQKLASSHPDAGGGLTNPQVDAASLNHARAALLDHEQRAIALLEALGGPSSSACKDLPDGFLMEMMSKREEIEEEIQSQEDQARARWESWARDERASYRAQASTLFGGLSVPPPQQSLKEIRTLLNAWRYIERLIEQLDPEYDPQRADFR